MTPDGPRSTASQDEIGDHLGITMVHVSRTLRRMRGERLVIVDHGVVTILEVERLRAAANGLPTAAREEVAAPEDARAQRPTVAEAWRGEEALPVSR